MLVSTITYRIPELLGKIHNVNLLRIRKTQCVVVVALGTTATVKNTLDAKEWVFGRHRQRYDRD